MFHLECSILHGTHLKGMRSVVGGMGARPKLVPAMRQISQASDGDKASSNAWFPGLPRTRFGNGWVIICS